MNLKLRRDSDVWNALICALFAVLCIVVSWPICGSGFDDDWSYAHIALNFARTGKLKYDGWAAPILLFQAMWGGWIIRLFGFSFTFLRLSTIPFAAGCAALTYYLGRKSGLSGAASCFGSATIASSPLFVPLAASFMTDVYGCFFCLLSLYCGICAMEDERRHARLWLIFAVAVGLMGGANRQIAWVAPLVVLSVAIWHSRSRTWSPPFALFLLLSAVAIMLLLLRWHSRQPLVVSEAAIDPDTTQGLVRHVALMTSVVCAHALTVVLVCLPAFVCFLDIGSVVSRHNLLKGFLPVGLMLAAMPLASVIGLQPRKLAPWIPNIVTTAGILRSGQDLLGDRPVVLPIALRLGITAIVFASLSYAIAALLSPVFLNVRRRGRTFASVSISARVLLSFSFIYFSLLLIPAYEGLSSDRHVLLVLPAAVVLALKLFESYRSRVPWFGWAVLGLYACYGIATTHDYYAGLRARVAAFDLLRSEGILPGKIDAGLEIDAWTQLELAGRMNNPLVRSPVDAYVPTPRTYPFWLSTYTTSLHPDYYLAWSGVPGLIRSPDKPILFSSWLPPFRRQVVILIRKDGAPS
jgi:hypothetical protein